MMKNSMIDLFKVIEQEKSILKIVTKTKNEVFFIEKWITHHLNILQDTRLIIFDNMSDDDYVRSIYGKYRDRIILVKFNGYMDCLHMANKFLPLYKSLSISSKFFTIIDSDEYLYFYDNDNGKIVKDSLVIKFLEDNLDCNFFVPCWIENIADNEKLLSFNPNNFSLFNWSKPIINTKLIQTFESALTKYECPILHHTYQLPISTYGKAPTKFLLLHLKNLNKYQRIKTNMQKLVALNIINNDKDFSALLKINPNDINHGRGYIIETIKLIEKILHYNDQHTDKQGTIELYDDGTLKFTPNSYEKDFIDLMNSDYFDLINFDPNKIDINQFTSIESCKHLL